MKFGELEQVRPVNNGRAWVRKDDLWGVIQLGELIDEPEPKNDSSSQATTTTYWTAATTASTIIIGYDELGQPIYSWVDPNEYTEPVWTPESTEPVTYDPTLDPGYTDPVVTEPVVTEPVYTEPLYTEPVNTDTVLPGVPEDPTY